MHASKIAISLGAHISKIKDSNLIIDRYIVRKYGESHTEVNLPNGWSALRGLVRISKVVILNLFLSLCLFD